jgi:hypothetical protein
MTRTEYVHQLICLGHARGELPIYGSPEWEALDQADPRWLASTLRAAECWRLDGTVDNIRTRLRTELDEADLYVRWRVRLAGLDVHTALMDQRA